MSWDDGRGPWSQQNGAGRPPGGGPPPDIEEWIREAQKRVQRFMPRRFRFGWLFALALAVWLGTGIYRVRAEEQGVVLRFGKFYATTAPGLHYHLPWPIESVLLPRVTIVNRVDIGVRLSETLPLNRAARDVPEESLMLTGDENIVDVDLSVFWFIKDAPNFLFKVARPPDAVKAVAESTMREVVGKSAIQPILTQDRQRIEEEVRRLMQETLDSYQTGIEISQVKMQKVDPPGAVIDSFRDVQAARADQERARNEAQAYRNKVIPETLGEAARQRREAEAYRERSVAEAEGEAMRFLSVYHEYRTAGEVTRRRIFLETLERVLEGANKVIIDSDKNGGSGVVPYLPLNELGRGRDGANTNTENRRR